MSLINDALQRAKTVQQIHPPPVADLPLRPIEPAQQQARGPGLVLPATLATVLCAGIFSWWLLNRTSHAAKAPETTPTVIASAASAPSVSSPAPAPGAATMDPAAAPGKASEPAAVPLKTLEPSASSTQPMTPAREAGAPVDATTTVEPAKPAPPRLQAITFNPARPSAIVSGKTVYVGDRFREFRVLKIDADSATLVNGTQTNVLTME